MLRDELALDGRGRLLDVGCGPGSLTLLLAALFERAIGVDADAEMLAEAARQAASRGVENVDWVHMRAEELPGDLGPSGPSRSRSPSTGWSATASLRLFAT